MAELNNSQGQNNQTNIYNAGRTGVLLHAVESMASEWRSLSLLQEKLRNQIKDQTESILLTNPSHPVILRFLSLEQACLQRAQLENVCLIKTAHSWRDTQLHFTRSCLSYSTRLASYLLI